MIRKGLTWTRYALVGWLCLIFLLLFVLSLKSRLHYDQGFMTYVAYLINEHGFVPYRDIFEFNLPVSYLFHMILGKFFGYGDGAFRIAHVTVLSVLLAIMWFIQKPQGKQYALISCAIFGIFYMGRGGALLLQRDVLGIIPVALVVLLNIRAKTGERLYLLHLLTGFLFAMAALVKPHLAIGLPFVFIYQFDKNYPDYGYEKAMFLQVIKSGSIVMLGFVIPIAGFALWLWNIGSLPAFLELFSSFVPVYGRISGGLSYLEVGGRLEYLVRHILLYMEIRYGTMFVFALLGVYLYSFKKGSDVEKKVIFLISSLVLAYIVYVILGGKFWDYHWLPFQYFACICLAYCFSPLYSSVKEYQQIIKVFLLLFFVGVFTLKPAYKSLTSFGNHPIPLEGTIVENDAYYNSVEEIRSYLQENLSVGDVVQPLDWIVGGVVHGMLLAGAVPATRHITDYEFYYDSSNPYIEQLRIDFSNQLSVKKPRYMIKSYSCELLLEQYRHESFIELDELLKRHYAVIFSNEYYEIYEVSSDHSPSSSESEKLSQPL